LTEKSAPNKIEWTAIHQEAFETLKQRLCEATKLNTFVFGQECGIIADSSGVAIGCCLIQWTAEGQEKPIAFASAKLTPTQAWWSTIEREAYSVVFALHKFRNFVFATRIWIYSNHNPLL